MSMNRQRAIWTFLGLAVSLIVAGSLFGPDPYAIDLVHTLSPPGQDGVLGTDELGRSLGARMLRGGVFSLTLMVSAACGSVALGTLLGALSGWIGGWTDRSIRLLINFFWSMPVAVFAVLVLAILTPTLGSMLLTIVAINWVGSARIVRSAVGALRDSPHVLSARARGFTGVAVFAEEIMPNLWPLITLLLGFSAAEALALEGGLSFLGAGPTPPTASWGAMLVAGLPYFLTAWWVAAIPALAMVATVAVARLLSRHLGIAMYR